MASGGIRPVSDTVREVDEAKRPEPKTAPTTNTARDPFEGMSRQQRRAIQRQVTKKLRRG